MDLAGRINTGFELSDLTTDTAPQTGTATFPLTGTPAAVAGGVAAGAALVGAGAAGAAIGDATD